MGVVMLPSARIERLAGLDTVGGVCTIFMGLGSTGGKVVTSVCAAAMEAGTGPARADISRASLMPPRVRPRSVDRSRLLDVLGADDSVFCAVVRAPAGYGKSTLLKQWCERADSGLVAWFSLDEYHDDPISFWSGFTAAIDRVVPGFGAGYLELLHRPGVSLLDSVMPRVVNEIVELPEPVTVVLDDLQTVTQRATLDSLAWLMSQLPRNLRLLIGTRTEPKLPLARLRAYGHLVELDATQLALDRHDAAAMIREMCPGLEEEHIQVAITKTEGWPAGLAMICMALAGDVEPASFLADFDGRDLTIENYLVEEVLNQLPREDRRWLQLTSVLDVLTPDACDAIAEVTDSAARLQRLSESNALLIGLDRHGTTYRYHHLFAECLQKRLLLADPDGYAAAHRRACTWHVDHDHPEAAFGHALQAGDVDLAARVATESGAFLMASGRTRTVRSQLQRLGEDVVVQYPDLALVGALVVGMEGSDRTPIDMPYYLDLALANPDRSQLGPDALRETASWLAVLFTFAPVGRTCALGDQVESFEEYRQGRLLALTMANYFAGRPDQTKRFAEQGLTSAGGAPDPRISVLEIALFIAYLANVATDAGQFDRAHALCDEAWAIFSENNMDEIPSAAAIPLALGRLFTRLGRYSEAEELLQRGLRVTPSWSTVRIFALLELARLAIDLEDLPTALDHLEKAATAIEAHEDAGALGSQQRALLRLCQSATADDPATNGPDLTDRELELLELFSKDLTNRQIAERLYISHNTVKSHLRVIYKKLGVASKADAVVRATQLGLYPEPPASPG